MERKVEPEVVFSPAVPKLFCGVEVCKPWTKSEDLPGRSYKTSNKISHPPLHAPFEFVEVRSLIYIYILIQLLTYIFFNK